MGRGEVIEDGEAFTEVCLNRQFYGFTGCIGDEAAHAGQLADLVIITTGAGLGHHGQRVELHHGTLHGSAHFIGLLTPYIDDPAVSFIVGHEAAAEEPFNLFNLRIAVGQDLILFRRYSDVVNADGNTGNQGVMEAQGLYGVQEVTGSFEAQFLEAVVDELAHLLLADGDAEAVVHHFAGLAVFAHSLFMALVEEPQFSRNSVVENQAARGGDDEILGIVIESIRTVFLRNPYFDEIVDPDFMERIGQHDFVISGIGMEMGCIHFIFCLFPFLHGIKLRIGVSRFFFRCEIDFRIVGGFHNGEVVGPQDHILGRNSDRLPILCRKNIVNGKHEGSCFCLCFHGQRQMAGHLVPIEVGVVARTYERMQLDSPAFPEDRFEGLDTEAVQRRRTVQEYRMFFDHVSQYIPHFRSQLVHFLAGCFQVAGYASLDQFMHNERLEEFDSHFLRQTALVHFQFRTDYNYGTAGVVDTFTEKVLAETTLLAFQHVRQGLQGPVAGAGNSPAAAAIIDERIHRFLEHTFFVPDDDFRSSQFHQSLQTVISVDDSSVQVVQVGGGETAAVQLDHWTKVRRNDRKNSKNHPFRLVSGMKECFHLFQTADAFNLTLTATFFDLLL